MSDEKEQESSLAETQRTAEMSNKNNVFETQELKLSSVSSAA
jgi:hypothetical protein